MGKVFYKRAEDTLAFGVVEAYRKYELRQARYHEMLPVLAPLLSPDLKILDVGSGFGEAKRFVDTLSKEPQWWGLELDPERIAACKRLGYSEMITNIDLQKQPLPLPDASFDVVIASHILEHLENTEEAMRDWYRVLKPGGVMILGVPMHLMFVAWIMRLWYRIKGRKPFAHCVFFNMTSLRRFLRPFPKVERIHGFRVISARKQLPLEDWHWFYRFSLWFGNIWPGATAEVNVQIRKPVA